VNSYSISLLSFNTRPHDPAPLFFLSLHGCHRKLNQKVKWKLFPESTAGLWQVIYLGLLRHKDKVPIISDWCNSKFTCSHMARQFLLKIKAPELCKGFNYLLLVKKWKFINFGGFRRSNKNQEKEGRLTFLLGLICRHYKNLHTRPTSTWFYSWL
jgi:hypothetical protein